ncbi:ribosome maturation factor RimM [Paenibacillus thalictri]|uniref:Ribosome maturation factor RimM n=1 Tax=Paenibacillus thalictri TaxID=2527873 RepID=A0A4Q9DQ23_9BACL|nr:ribosome maturation factor RimM [Paenibacillus thalictri]TBL77703.1 ribosome maturation factor RimM [Paenibacillus thalictri]
MSDKLYTVGKLVNTHGIRGEIKIVSQTDFPDLRFAKGSELILLDPDKHTQMPVVVESSREHKGMFIVKLKSYNDINDVEKYKGWLVKVAEEHLADLDEDEYYYHEIIGCLVVTDEEQELGEITEILSPGANDVWVVKLKNGKQALLPVIDEVILDVDVEAKTVRVHIMEGLLD